MEVKREVEKNDVMARHVPDLITLGAVLRDLRTNVGYTQERLSLKSGLTTALISDSENGKRNLSFESMERILSALDVSWADFGAALHIAARSRKKDQR
jgi:transcriptional regulator with XRE-family HTH domain